MDRLAIGARSPLKVLEAVPCSSKKCRVPSQRNWVHIQTLFVSTLCFYDAEAVPELYLIVGQRLYFIRDAPGFYQRFAGIRQSDLHPVEDEQEFKKRLHSAYPEIVFPMDFAASLRRKCMETQTQFKLVFFLALEYVGVASLKTFNGLVRAGTWGGQDQSSAVQIVLVLSGSETLRFLMLPREMRKLIGGEGMRQQHIEPVNLKHLVETPQVNSADAPTPDSGSPDTCPCQSGELLFRNLPPKKLSTPVGYLEAPKDLEANLELFGLKTPIICKVLDVCTWLSCVFFDVER